MAIEIRLPELEEVDDFYRNSGRVLGWDISDQEIPRHKAFLELDRTMLAFDEGNMVGGLTSYPYELSVPGTSSAVAAVAWVTVQPTHRRRGIFAELTKYQLSDLHDKNIPFAALWSSESIIYGRFGYGIGTVSERWEIERHQAGLARFSECTGRVRYIEKSQITDLLPNVYSRIFRCRSGMMGRTSQLWEDRLWQHDHLIENGEGSFCAVYEENGTVEGYVFYVHDKFDKVLTIRELLCCSSNASVALWEFLFNMDGSEVIKVGNRPPDDPIPWMLADPRRLNRTVSDGIWLRIVDVMSALKIRKYSVEGDLVLEVRDRTCSWNHRKFELSADPSGAICRFSDSDPDISLDISDLSATYLGTTSFTLLNSAKRIEAATPASLHLADAMFSMDLAPWCTQDF